MSDLDDFTERLISSIYREKRKSGKRRGDSLTLVAFRMINPSAVGNDLSLKINEIFYSIQGESSRVGFPTVFVRTTACDLRCTYCDTKYSYYEGSQMSLDEIVKKISSYSARYVCVTGGEPLLQKNVLVLMRQLCDSNFEVSLETHGGRPIEDVDSRVKIILDVKTPDSGAGNSFHLENLAHLRPNTEIKFVICSEKDFEWAENFCRQYEIFKKCPVLYSPSFEHLSPTWLAEKILQQKSSARLQLQLHKYIWSPTARGV